VDRGIALPFLDLGARRGCVVSATPRPHYPRERTDTHCTGGWVGPRVCLDLCEKSRPYRDSIPGTSSPQSVAILTELSGPLIIYIYIYIMHGIKIKIKKWFSYLLGVEKFTLWNITCCIIASLLHSFVFIPHPAFKSPVTLPQRCFILPLLIMI
jgi:hypothetical protein